MYNKYITLGLTCKKYSPNNNNSVVYVSLRVYKDLYENNKGLFLVGKKVYLKGYLNSYSDKNKTIHNYVKVTKIEKVRGSFLAPFRWQLLSLRFS